jgi:hypothetical protein
MKQNIHLILKMALSGKYFFHGSSFKNDEVQPTPTTRASIIKKQFKIKYKGTSLHATPCLYVALLYVASRAKIRDGQYGIACDLFENDNEIEVSGPSTKQDAIQTLYGEGGYLYVLPKDDFVWFKGLGDLEVVSFSPVKPFKRFFISYEDWNELIKFTGTAVFFEKTRIKNNVS